MGTLETQGHPIAVKSDSRFAYAGVGYVGIEVGIPS
jgi:hypothetical protein